MRAGRVRRGLKRERSRIERRSPRAKAMVVLRCGGLVMGGINV